MLKNQTQLNQKDLLALESQAPPPSRSRFDQQFRPGQQSQLAQPGTIAIFSLVPNQNLPTESSFLFFIQEGISPKWVNSTNKQVFSWGSCINIVRFLGGIFYPPPP